MKFNKSFVFATTASLFAARASLAQTPPAIELVSSVSIPAGTEQNVSYTEIITDPTYLFKFMVYTVTDSAGKTLYIDEGLQGGGFTISFDDPTPDVDDTHNNFTIGFQYQFSNGRQSFQIQQPEDGDTFCADLTDGNVTFSDSFVPPSKAWSAGTYTVNIDHYYWTGQGNATSPFNNNTFCISGPYTENVIRASTQLNIAGGATASSTTESLDYATATAIPTYSFA